MDHLDLQVLWDLLAQEEKEGEKDHLDHLDSEESME